MRQGSCDRCLAIGGRGISVGLVRVGVDFGEGDATKHTSVKNRGFQ